MSEIDDLRQENIRLRKEVEILRAEWRASESARGATEKAWAEYQRHRARPRSMESDMRGSIECRVSVTTPGGEIGYDFTIDGKAWRFAEDAVRVRMLAREIERMATEVAAAVIVGRRSDGPLRL